jgi:hypothetical protein
MAGVPGWLKAGSGQALEEDAWDPQSRVILGPPHAPRLLSRTFAPGSARIQLPLP